MKQEILKQLPKLIRAARLEQGITQIDLANKVGCKQSAISMMEGGRVEAIAEATYEKLAEVLNINIAELAPVAAPILTAATIAPLKPEVAMCANFQCPSNKPYIVGSDIYFMPTGKAGFSNRCAICGEILIKVCPHCGVKLQTLGGCCGHCGKPLLEFPEGYTEDVVGWVEQARIQSEQL